MIREFLDKNTLKAMDLLLAVRDEEKASEYALVLSDAFGGGSAFKLIADASTDGETKLIGSFNNNLILLIQKTWVEKSDEELKAQVLYRLEEFTSKLHDHKYTDSYEDFFDIVESVVYLMFGNQSKSDDFSDYALRIDPEFGIFWWYFKNLPRESEWSEKIIRTVLLLGMYFLANY